MKRLIEHIRSRRSRTNTGNRAALLAKTSRHRYGIKLNLDIEEVERCNQQYIQKAIQPTLGREHRQYRVQSLMLRGVNEHVQRCGKAHDNASEDDRHNAAHQQLDGNIGCCRTYPLRSGCVLDQHSALCTITVGHEPHCREHCDCCQNPNERIEPFSRLDLADDIRNDRIDIAPP